ncbi:hypothetical protein BU23DRAFT_44164 [Bimuria novae-zelandiae CBS 107.79]|uniref:Uncharacterized protein n=1 Tax=Bimuria novae-zelandiae CBS 107.79 TaxID=1447943 RepID=A0A6A5VFH0_9PLEO|nr:hypothetical protein BU23DRAFT_44164 [Bimuria novae-zelandiae CBS 107.79]
MMRYWRHRESIWRYGLLRVPLADAGASGCTEGAPSYLTLRSGFPRPNNHHSNIQLRTLFITSVGLSAALVAFEACGSAE